METFCSIGDILGYVSRSQKFGETTWRWRLVEAKVRRLAICKDGVHVYTKEFCPLDDDEIKGNTKIMNERTSLILVQEPFVLNDETRARVERWVAWMNENPDNAAKATPFVGIV